LIRLRQHSLGDFWDKIVQENIEKAFTYGLSDGQLTFILDKSSAGKPGLAIRFKDKLKIEGDPVEEQKPVTTPPPAEEEEVIPPTSSDSNPW
jgi:hypothetical protein